MQIRPFYFTNVLFGFGLISLLIKPSGITTCDISACHQLRNFVDYSFNNLPPKRIGCVASI